MVATILDFRKKVGELKEKLARRQDRLKGLEIKAKPPAKSISQGLLPSPTNPSAPLSPGEHQQ